MLVVNTEKVLELYNEFIEREQTEIEKARNIAKQTAQELGWDKISTEALVAYIVSKAHDSLQKEQEFWNQIVSEQEDNSVQGTPILKVIPYTQTSNSDDAQEDYTEQDLDKE